MSYKITIAQANPRRASVEARFPMRDPLVLTIADENIPGLDNAWAHFIDDVRLEDADGQKIVIEKLTPARWRARGRAGSRVTLRYSFKLEHDEILPQGTPPGRPRYNWQRSMSEVAYAKPWAFFTTGNALFITAEDMRDIGVSLELPRGWTAAASWNEIDTVSPTFRAADRGELLSGLLVAGEIERFSRKVDRLTVDFALGGPAVVARRAHVEQLVGALRHYVKMFGSAPRQALGRPYSSILIVLNAADGLLFGGGLAGKDIAMLVPPDGRLSAAEKDASLAHELFHLWNARSFRYRSRHERWFSEGFTTYYGFQAVRAMGRTDDAGFLGSLA